jgi:hypothetical protein
VTVFILLCIVVASSAVSAAFAICCAVQLGKLERLYRQKWRSEEREKQRAQFAKPAKIYRLKPPEDAA